GLDVLDGAGLDDGEESLGVTAGPGGDGRRRSGDAPTDRCGRRGGRDLGATTGGTVLRGLRALEEVGGDAAGRAVAGGCGRLAARRRALRGSVAAGLLRLGLLASFLGSLAQVLWDLGHQVLARGPTAAPR